MTENSSNFVSSSNRFWGLYLTGREHTPMSVIKHEEHFDFVPRTMSTSSVRPSHSHLLSSIFSNCTSLVNHFTHSPTQQDKMDVDEEEEKEQRRSPKKRRSPIPLPEPMEASSGRRKSSCTTKFENFALDD